MTDRTGDAPGPVDLARQVQTLLTPLRERQARWISGRLDDDADRPDQSRAQPLVVRLEKDDPPQRAAALSAAAAVWLSPYDPVTASKAMAQVGHASMLLAIRRPRRARRLARGRSVPVAVRTASHAAWAALAEGPADPDKRFAYRSSMLVRDAGFTEVRPGTVTAVTTWPTPGRQAADPRGPCRDGRR